jgi:hypothetical protein
MIGTGSTSVARHPIGDELLVSRLLDPAAAALPEHRAELEPTAVQQAQVPAFDIGLDKIEAIEPERCDDGVEGGQGDQLLYDRGPPGFRRSEMGQAEAEAAVVLDRKGERGEPGTRAERYRQHNDITETVQPYDGAQDRARIAPRLDRVDPARRRGTREELRILSGLRSDIEHD